MPHAWFRAQDLALPATMRLFCLPHAGSGASSYYRWRAWLPAGVVVCPVLLPGRELAFAVPPLASLRTIVHGLVEAVAQQAATFAATPFAIYGHSMGSLLAYEWTRALCAAGLPMPKLLVVGGRNAPQLPLPPPDLHTLDPDTLLTELQARYGALPAEVLADPSARELLLPLIRADLMVVETYRYRPGARLAVPLAAFAGSDDSTVTRAGLVAWADLTQGPVQAEFLPGDHFFHLGAGQRTLLERLSALL